MGGSRYGGERPPDFVAMTTEETQKHFEQQRLVEQQSRLQDRRTKVFDVEVEIKKALTVVSRELTKLMHLSKEMAPLEPKNHDAIIAYTKLVTALKRQSDEDLEDMQTDELEKLADEG